MAGGADQRTRGEVRMRLVADPASVPAARRFVRDALAAWRLEDVAEDASLCVSELSSNAALHSASAFFDIVVETAPGVLRLCVDDEGEVPAEAVVPRDNGAEDPAEGAADSLEALASTGRGLMIVSALATDWGVEQHTRGKRVWAHLPLGADVPGGEEQQAGAEPDAARHPPTPAAPSEPAPSPRPAHLPQGWHVVRLVDCPVELSLRQDRHLDELIRELQLVQAGETTPSEDLAAVIAGLLQEHAQARHMGRLTAQRAQAAGLERVDVEMTMPAAAAGDVQRLHQAVREADSLCARQELLTLASGPELMQLREWMAREVSRQIQYGEPPVPYERWVGARDET